MRRKTNALLSVLFTPLMLSVALPMGGPANADTVSLLVNNQQTIIPAGASVVVGSSNVICAGPTQGVASNYPTSLAFGGLKGQIVDVDLSITSLSHSHTPDLLFALQGPNGATVLLQNSGRGSSEDVVNVTYRYDDEAASPLPSGTTFQNGASYRPSGGAPSDSFPVPGPGAFALNALSGFDGISPNGTWQLWINDALAGDCGRVQGWQLQITTTSASTWTGLGANSNWTNGTNWNPLGEAPGPGFDLTFPTTSPRPSSVNDTAFTYRSLTTTSGEQTIGGGPIFLTSSLTNAAPIGGSAAAPGPRINAAVVAAGPVTVSNGGKELTLGGGLAGAVFPLGITGAGTTTVTGALTGSGGLSKTGPGILNIRAAANSYSGSVTVNAGTFVLGTAPGTPASLPGAALTVGGGTLGGVGTVGALNLLSGALDPDRTITVNGTFQTAAPGALLFGAEGTAVGAFDRIAVAGGVTLGGATLIFTPNVAPPPGTSLILIDKASGGAVAGTFAGLAEGATFAAGSSQWRISYIGGDGNDVAVSVVGGAAGLQSRFEPLPPFRIFDSRPNEPGPGPKGYIGAGQSVDIQVTGVGGVPSVGATAAVINLTATAAAGPGFVTAFAAGQPRPLASNVNLAGAGATAPNLVVVPLGSAGQVTLFSSGGAHLVADVTGYFSASPGAVAAGRLVSTGPARLFDTRPAEPGPGPKGFVPAGQTISVQITGAAGLPASGISAAVLNLTGTEAAGPGFVIAYPAGQARPLASSLNLTGIGHTAANLVIVPVGVGGRIELFAAGGAHLLGDVTGYFTDATAPAATAGLFVPLTAGRLFDTRPAEPGAGPKGAVAAGGTIVTNTAGVAAIPAANVAAAMLNVTATEAGGAGFVTAFPAGQARPPTSTLNLTFAGETRANASIMALGTGGQVAYFTQAGAHLLADTSGYFTAA